LNEFLCFYELIVESGCADPTPHQMARELFSIFDIDGSGNVTLNEFVKTLEAFNLGFTIEDIGEILHELDEDGNGSISLKEFENVTVKYFPKEILAQTASSAMDDGSASHPMLEVSTYSRLCCN
jgi:Ca2+-binding EF-hand superfamily protein